MAGFQLFGRGRISAFANIVDTLARSDSTKPGTTIKVDTLPGVPYQVRNAIAPNSRHVYGDAADINPNVGGKTEWQTLVNLASTLHGYGICIEPYNWSPSHLHLDTRRDSLAFNPTTSLDCGGRPGNGLITVR